jgi:tetratricopeptide (TPR) repeat protein
MRTAHSISQTDIARTLPLWLKFGLSFLVGSALALLPHTKAAASEASPAERKIAAAQRFIEKNTSSPTGYVELAMGYARRARETAGDDFYDKAMTAVDKALAIDATNFEAKKVRVWILLGQHEFVRAAAEASALNKLVPDDVTVYGLMTDAFIETGRYEEAEKAAQWMLDLRGPNVPALTRASYLRELFGDIDGALEAMSMALARISETEYEERAWLLTHVAHLQLLSGKTDLAEQAVREALKTFPDYHYALAKLAQVRMKQGRASDAVTLLRKHYEAGSHPENLFELAVAMHAAGQRKEATHAFRKFEKEALEEADGVDNANRELSRYYADFANKPKEALHIAKIEFDRRQDIYTISAYAWALHKNARSKEALAIIERATAMGTRDARIRFHAGAIAQANQQFAKAKEHFEIAAGTSKDLELSRAIRTAIR